MESALKLPSEAVAERATKADRRTYRRIHKRPPGGRGTPLTAIRRFNALVAKFTAEAERGRRELHVAEREMVRQAAAIMLRAEQLQAAIVSGAAINPDELIRLSSEGRRVLRALGIRNGSEKPRSPLWSPLRARLNVAAVIGSAPVREPEEALP
jgi:hypothetical protein